MSSHALDDGNFVHFRSMIEGSILKLEKISSSWLHVGKVSCKLESWHGKFNWEKFIQFKNFRFVFLDMSEALTAYKVLFSLILKFIWVVKSSIWILFTAFELWNKNEQ